MTEENKDAPPPKLRLSREPKEQKTEPQAEAEAEPEKAAEPKPDLKLKRPSAEPQSTEPPKAETKEPASSIKSPVGHPEGEPSVQPTDERPFDPENPFAGIDIKKPKPSAQPPELPSKPAPPQKDGSGRKVEEAIGRIGEEKKSHGMLTSIIAIVLLLVVLGAPGYGHYYILRNPSDTPEESATTAKQAKSEATEEESGGLLRGPITKAKEAIAKIPGSADALEETTEASAPVEQAQEKANPPDPVEPTESTPVAVPKAESPAVDSPQTSAVSELLQNAHIGGVRTGDSPKVILNGKSYNQGDLVDPDTGLRFAGMRDGKLAFRDAQGVVYLKSF